ncbi:MAG: AAA family ATPase [Pseudomonadota bacterium]
MKILALRFKNLNSLYGEWLIDFSYPEYVSNGIFALAGPTGAGKSTILDAICLALYGATPRLGRITRSSNEIMSRLTGECYAEVTFASQAGTFRCHWAQHRAHKKPEGNLLDARHEIADAQSGRILESKKRDVAAVIEEKTGMDFDRFTRSILLAQGGFDTFLKADVEQKSKILEQITGTEIYTEISQRVHEKLRDERDKLQLLQAETIGIQVLDEQQEAEISRELSEKKKSEAATIVNFQETGKAMEWLTGIHTLQNEMMLIVKESEAAAAASDSFLPEREKLSRAQKAAELEGVYATLLSIRKQQESDRNALQNDETAFPGIRASAAQKEELLKNAEAATAKAKEKQKSLSPLIQKVRMLDQQISDRKKSIHVGEADCRKIADQIADCRTDLDRKTAIREKDRKALAAIEAYLAANAGDESLVVQLAGIEEQINHLQIAFQEISEKKQALASAKSRSETASQTASVRSGEWAGRNQENEAVRKKLALKKAELAGLLGDRLLREYRAENESLLREMAFHRKIADLESERIRLEDGKPCPLCGSEKHPYAEGNVPAVDETEKKIHALSGLIRKAERFESSIKDLESSEKDASAKAAAAEKRVAEALNEMKDAENGLIRITGELVKADEGFARWKAAVLNRLLPFGIREIPEGDASSLLSDLKHRLRKWQENLQKKEKMEKQQMELDSEMNRLHAVIETRNQSMTEKQNAIGVLKAEYEGQVAERRELFGQKMPDAEETGLETLVSEASQGEKTVRKERDSAGQLLDAATVRMDSLKERISKSAAELQVLESDFIRYMKAKGFPDEPSFVAGLLPSVERNRLATRAKALDDRMTEIQARKTDRENRLAREWEKKVTDSTREELTAVYQKLEEALKQIRDDISGLKHKLIENDSAREKIRNKQALIDARKNECRRWERLHSLIGSADGKKYRNFAQGLTFELMISHANRQLAKLTDRYLLIRDAIQPLELSVVDGYQAGEIRSTRNLSGGESFIVSLSLALGLSQMAGRKVRVDSLFLDEGFGTLDEDVMETALETLAGLHQDGKLIGIISHVTALKERISTQIDIIPAAGGKSLIAGPGCMQLP